MTLDSPFVRQWLLLKTLSARRYGATVKEMADEMGVNEKTIRRDLHAFRDIGFPLEEEVGEFGRKTWKLKPAWNQSDMSFTFEEAVSLYLARRLLEPLAGTMFWRSAQSAFKKIRASLSEHALRHLEEIGDQLHHTTVRASDYSRKSEIIDNLMIGLEDQQVVQIAYRFLWAAEPVTYEVHPYGMIYHRGSLYMVAFSEQHDDLRRFKLDRIAEAEVSAFPFCRLEEFDVRKHLEPAFGLYQGNGSVEVQVRFLSPVVRYVTEAKWHDSQELEPQKDGSVIATFRLNETEEIKHWILSFGRHAVVMAPRSLQDEVLAEARALVRAYTSGKSIPEVGGEG